jgi:hypothetical protein
MNPVLGERPGGKRAKREVEMLLAATVNVSAGALID